MNLAVVRAGHRLDAVRPAPARLQRHAGRARPAHAHDVDPRLVGRPCLVGRREVTHFQPGHRILLASWTTPLTILNRLDTNLRPLSSSQPVRLLEATLSREGGRLAIQTQADAYEVACRLLDNIETVVHGKREQITLVVAALVCGGHVLLEDVPGTAKTVLARAIAQSIEGAHASRIQCTPDLQPTDVTGLSIFNQRERDFEFRPGPGVRQRRPRGRDQPRDAEDAVRPARGDGRAAGDRRRRHTRARRAVPRDGDPEPDRVRRHVPAAGGAARPLLRPHRRSAIRTRTTRTGSWTSSSARIH